MAALDGWVHNAGCQRLPISFSLNKKPEVSLSLNNIQLWMLLFCFRLARCLYIIASASYIDLLIFFSVQKCFKKVNASANRLKQKYCRIPFAIPASEIRFKLKEITCTCGTKNIEKNSKKTWKMDEYSHEI